MQEDSVFICRAKVAYAVILNLAGLLVLAHMYVHALANWLCAQMFVGVAALP